VTARLREVSATGANKLGLGTAWCGRYTVTVDIQVGSIPISLAKL